MELGSHLCDRGNVSKFQLLQWETEGCGMFFPGVPRAGNKVLMGRGGRLRGWYVLSES